MGTFLFFPDVDFCGHFEKTALCGPKKSIFPVCAPSALPWIEIGWIQLGAIFKGWRSVKVTDGSEILGKNQIYKNAYAKWVPFSIWTGAHNILLTCHESWISKIRRFFTSEGANLGSKVVSLFFLKGKCNFLDRLVGHKGTATAMYSMAMSDVALIEQQ